MGEAPSLLNSASLLVGQAMGSNLLCGSLKMILLKSNHLIQLCLETGIKPFPGRNRVDRMSSVVFNLISNLISPRGDR